MKEAVEQLNEEFGIGLSEEEIPSIAVQIVGKSFDEATVLQVAHAYELPTEWHKRKLLLS
jgi:Asp-tRNA(Asn)/Glu-tRNA(Gln) amidotransferase A subunit family amidase